MDFKLLFSGGKDIPADVRMIYGGLIKRHQKLKNGWSAVLLRNNMAYLYKTMHSLFLSAASNAYSRRQTASLCWSKKTAKKRFYGGRHSDGGFFRRFRTVLERMV